MHLKEAIDSGSTGDKVASNDPAAAPLGTDEEAAGTPLPPSAIRKAYKAETNRSAPEARLLSVTGWVIVMVALLILTLTLSAMWVWSSREAAPLSRSSASSEQQVSGDNVSREGTKFRSLDASGRP
jgi:hypothetical protein